MAKLLTSRSIENQYKTWFSNAVQYQRLSIRHFGANKIGYENSGVDKGYVEQITFYNVTAIYARPTRKVYAIAIDIVSQHYEQANFPTCIVVATHKGRIVYVKRVFHSEMPHTCANALITGIYGDKDVYIDENNMLKLPKNIVSVCMHHFDEIWSSE